MIKNGLPAEGWIDRFWDWLRSSNEDKGQMRIQVNREANLCELNLYSPYANM